jgi:hypothetical protein
MAQQFIENGESGLDCRNAINGNFTELYNALNPPIFLFAVLGDVSQDFLPNTWVERVFLRPIAGFPVIRIGTTPGGNDILDDFYVEYPAPILVQQYFSVSSTIYFTWLEDGELNIRIDLINNFD